MSANKPKTITVKDLKNLKNAEEAFAIKERIGAGTYGEVFTAMHKEKAKMVAIKAMNLQPDEVHEIVSEVNTLSQYSDHNNIARYFGCYIKRGPVAQIWIAMEYCAGGSIFDLIKHGGNNGKHYFKEEWIAYASREILEGLKYLHSMKVIHRDIKGQNILLTDKAEVKLVDFGVSAKLDKTVGKRCTFIGTPYWMAPEVIECEKDPSKSYTFECDIWSTGITAMEMAEGKPPLNDLHPMTALFKIPSNEPPKLKNPRDWSDKFKEFLKLCLKKNYKQRPSAENLLSYSRFVKAVNADRAQADLRQAIERVHRTKGHSRKLQRDMILRPDEGTSLEESDDEDNPETIKTIREQFRKMDNNPKQPFVPQPPQPQVVSSQVSHVAPPFHNRLNQSSAPQSQQQQAPRERGVDGGVDVNIRKMYENQNNKEDRRFIQKPPPPLSSSSVSPPGANHHSNHNHQLHPVAPARSTSQHNGFPPQVQENSKGGHDNTARGNDLGKVHEASRGLEAPRGLEGPSNLALSSRGGPLSHPNDDVFSSKIDNHNQKASNVPTSGISSSENIPNSPPNWRPALVTNAVIEDHLSVLASHLAEASNDPRMSELDYLKRRSGHGLHSKQTSEPVGFNRQVSESSAESKNKFKGKILPDKIPLDCMKSAFMPSANHSPQTPPSNNNPFDYNNRSTNNFDASDRKSSVPFLNGNNPPLSTPPNSKEELSRKNSHEAGGNHGMNGHKPPFPLSASSENNRVQDLKSSHQQDVNKRSSRNFETSLSTDLDKTPTPASAVHANAPVRRHQNDPTPELPRKAHQPIQVTAKVDQNPPRKFSEQAQPRPLAKFEQPRKMSEHNPIARPSSAVKDLRQHPISRQNAPLARVTPAPISQTSVSIASNMSDRPLPAQPPKSSNPPMSSSSNNQSTPGGAAKFSHAIGQRQSISVMESSTESQNSKGIWNRSSRNVGGAEGPQNPSSAIGMPLKLENIEHSPGARRKSYAARSEELQPRIDNSGYAQLRLEGSVTESSSTDLDRERAHKPPSNVAPQHQNQPSFPYVDSDQDSTLSKPSTVKRANYSFEDSFTSCFNNSAYSNSEEERRKVMKSQNAEHSPNLSTSASNNSSVMNSGNSGHHRGQEVPVSRHNQVPNSGFGNTNDAGERDIPKHWQRGPPSSASVANSEYGSSAPVSTRQQMESSHQQHQIKSKGAVINPDYGTNINSNAVSNDQYGVSSKLGQDPAGFGRRVIDDVNNSIAVSNQAYDVNQLSASVDSDYESLVGPSRVVSKEPPQHIYTNQLDAVPEVEHQRRPNNQPNPERFDDSGVYAQFDADAAAYEVLYPPNAQHQPPQSETNNNNLKDPLPQPMPRNMSVSRERLAPSSSSEKSQEIHGAVSGRSSAANSSTNLHLSVGSESSVSLADDVTGGGASESSAVASRATEDEVSDDSDKEQADRFGTILVSSKPKPIQSEVSSRRIREASSGASSNKQMNRLSMGECSSSGSIKSTKSSNAAPLPNTSQQPTQPATNTTTTTTTNNSQGNEAVPRGHHKKSASRSKSQERPASQMSKKPAVVDLDNSARRPQQQQGATGGDERRQPHQDGSVANAVNLRKSKESKSGRSMEDISNKRASMVSVPSSQNMHADASRTPPDSKGPGVTSETPRSKISAADSKLKRQSTAENSPHNRSRKGSSSDHKAGHFNSFGFGVGGSGSPSSVNVPINISNNSGDSNPNASAASAINPEIRKFLKKFKSEVLCACLWGVNLLIGTTKGLYFMDRSGGCDVIRLVSDRKFTQMEIIPSLSLLVTISGKNNRLREYYLKVLHGKIVKQDQPSSGGKTSSHEECGDIGSKIEHCNSFKIVKYDAIRFLVVAYKTGIIVLAWAPKPCHKFMAVTEYKELKGEPLFVNVAIREAEAGGKFVLKVVYATNLGFHVVDDSGSQDIFMPTVYGSPDSTIRPHCIMTFPKSDEPAFLLCYNSEGAYVTDEGKFFRDAFLQWGEAPITSVAAVGSHHIMGWAPSAIEFRSLTTGQLDGVFMQRNTFKMRFLCECNDKVFFSSYSKSGVSQIYLLTLNHQSMIGSK
ncbi:uncharacterized protein LOC142345654 isoform X2 [Convolutriloba macropyga]|uniref:uncharacterized protein LOC142345654 isoform X2 n=1 Tax=Convolutriloba macropyga TaxID=536237 RepID=UPI003F5252AC